MRRPEIHANFVLSADGKISTPTHSPSTWSSSEDTQRYFSLRKQADAVLVGRGTLGADNMSLTTEGHRHWRCVVTNSGKLPADSPLFLRPGGPIHLIGECAELSPELRSQVTVHRNVQRFLAHAADSGVQRVLCEGGGQLLKSLIKSDLLDVLHLTWTGRFIFGGRQSPTCTGLPGDFLPKSVSLELISYDPSSDGSELFLSYRVKRGAEGAFKAESALSEPNL